MESRIENSYLGSACGKNSFACFDTDEVCRVVQGAEVEAVSDDLLNVVVNDNGLAVVLTAVEYSVTYGCDLGYIGDNSVILVYKLVEDHCNGNLVIGHSCLDDYIILTGSLVCELAVDTDPLGVSLSEDIACIDIEKLELTGRTSAVDNQNVHKYISPDLNIVLIEDQP
jgi:hypothetical protein